MKRRGSLSHETQFKPTGPSSLFFWWHTVLYVATRAAAEQRVINVSRPGGAGPALGLGFGAGAHDPLALVVLHVGFTGFSVSADG